MTNWTYIKKDSYLYQVFGDRPVKIESLVPAVPREEGAPPCYWALANDFSDSELLQLSIVLYEQWKPECRSIAEAEAYIKEKNLPLAIIHTTGCMTDEGQNFPWIAAMNLAARGLELQENESNFEDSSFDVN